MKPKYLKIFSSAAELVSVLQERGMSIDDREKASSYIHNIGYFRLSAYFYPLLQEPKAEHKFKIGSRFKQVMDIYRFDRKLRLLCFNEIEKIEVAIRSIIINTASEFYNDPFWITNPDNFKIINSYDKKTRKKFAINCYDGFIGSIDKDIARSKEDFIKHFQNTYSDKYPPSWMIAEILTFGNLSRIYKGIKQASLKKKIAIKIGLQADVFESWMLSLAGLRNICCHHSRLWNRVLPLSVMSPKNTEFAWLACELDSSRTFFRLSMIKYLLFSVSPHNNYKSKLIVLLAEFPSIDINAMGFPKDWQEQPLWKYLK